MGGPCVGACVLCLRTAGRMASAAGERGSVRTWGQRGPVPLRPGHPERPLALLRVSTGPGPGAAWLQQTKDRRDPNHVPR